MVILGDFGRPKTLKCATTAHTKLIKSVDDFDRREWPLDPGETFGEGQQLMRYLCHSLHIADERKVTFAFREKRRKYHHKRRCHSGLEIVRLKNLVF